ncbi:unnamed protein product [Rotaria sordida]|uniref:Uncharacterized protein n=1 Tax=Rotaria sordida TaxID=392033 RepID=A0A815RIB9_9BILA|nr:unnamed protein product [Rotaria sordida]
MSNYLAQIADKFLQQKADYDWIVESCSESNGEDLSEQQTRSTENSTGLPSEGLKQCETNFSENTAVCESTSCNFPAACGKLFTKRNSKTISVSNNDLTELTDANSENPLIDQCEERIVVTTFPNNITKADFNEYIDRKFFDLDNNIKETLKQPFECITNNDMEKSVYFDNTNGSISATLTQMLYERTSDEIKVSVGYIKFTTRPTQNCWQNDTERVMRALQYRYGLQLKNELDYSC